MKTIQLENDISLLCLKAKSFPEGIQEAYDELHIVIKNEGPRKYFGISRPNGDEIEYYAAVESFDHIESEKFGLPIITIKSGNYLFEEVLNYMSNIKEIGRIFSEMISNPNIDPKGYCVEVYITDKDVQCMVRLND
jgi:predicted transcriptional regulator YdeE